MYYVDTLNYEKLIKTAINSMLESLDPYTVYIPESETDDITMMTSGEYGGIGAIITKTSDGICISEPYEGMPAQKHGLKAGDVILEIDGTKTDKLTVSEVSAKLKGTPNTEISIKIRRPGSKSTVTKKFLREKIQIPPITYSYIPAPKTGYLLLNDFTERAALEVKSTIQEMVNQHKIESIIIDLRNNGGGLIDEAVKIMGYFVPKGTEIVSTKGKNLEELNSYKTTLDPIFPDMKIAVLVNSSSASASEILAGAVQDLDRGVVIGERTFGKGLVQNIRPVSYGGFIKITTAKYYIPSGRCIQAIDYAQLNEDGSVRRIPENLTREFSTKNGRKVRDGGGIVPDTITQESPKITIAYYLYTKNIFFDYATVYVSQHETITEPAKFRLSDKEYEDFVGYVKGKNIKYTSLSQNEFEELKKIIKAEDKDKELEQEIKALGDRLTVNIDSELKNNKATILGILEAEIVKRYYYQKGVIEYSLSDDVDLSTSLGLLGNSDLYESILKVKN
ncbi:S41 family peptidase [Paludibacter sp.]